MKKIALSLFLLSVILLLPMIAYAVTNSLQDTFSDTDGMTLQAHNPELVNVFTNGANNAVIQSNKAQAVAPADGFPFTYFAYSLSGSSPQSGNQCISFNFMLNESNMGVGAALYAAVNAQYLLTKGYVAAISKQPDDNALFWSIQSVDQTINRRVVTAQRPDWTQQHAFQFCDIDGMLSLSMDGTTLETRSDNGTYSVGEPFLFADQTQTVDDVVYGDSVPGQ